MGCCCCKNENSEKDKGDKRRKRHRNLLDKEYIARFDYIPGCDSEVPLTKGDRVEMMSIEIEKDDFVFVRLLKEHGTRGYVPFKCLATKDVPKLDDEDAQPPAKRELPKKLRERWREIPRNQLQMLDTLGEGKFGEVKRARWTPPGEAPRMVVVKNLHHWDVTTKQALLDEACMMRDLRHENIVRLLGVVSSSEPCLIVTELINDGSIEKYFSKRRCNRLEPLQNVELLDICAQICRGMAYLHSKNRIHRDLAARNVLIDITSKEPFACTVKISDFGLARALDESKVYMMKHDTYLPTKFLAPEAFQNEFSPQTDVWAFGVTLWQLYSSGKEPYEDWDDQKVEAFVKEPGHYLEKPESMPPEVYKLLRKCCDRDWEERPSFKKLQRAFEKLIKSVPNKENRRSRET